MTQKEKTTLIIILICSVIGLALISLINSTISLTKSMNIYSAGLEDYKNNNYIKASKKFHRISVFSTLKPAAIYREATALEHAGRNKAAIRKYTMLANGYKNFSLRPKAIYQAAVLLYKEGKYSSAKSKFKYVRNKYSDTEYATASEYYLGMIEYHSLKNITNQTQRNFAREKALTYYRQYLQDAAGGRYAQNCINRIEELLNKKISKEDAYLIAKSYTALYDNKTAAKYYEKTYVPRSWTDIVNNDYELQKYESVRALTIRGMREFSTNVDSKDVYKAIDKYLATYPNNKTQAIKNLVDTNTKANGYDYVKYLECKTVSSDQQKGCYEHLYYTYPNGQFAADALYNIFYSAVKKQQWLLAKSLGHEHLKNYPNSKSTPAVMFWLAKVYTNIKYYDDAQKLYKNIIQTYPDDYYAFQAYLNSKKISNPILKNDINPKPVKFPYRLNKENDMIVKLAMLEDYSLLQSICDKDKFIKSWIEYQKGEYSISAVTARDAMDELKEKPADNDLRWRLVYPVHYYDEIKQYSDINNPIIILSLIREESYFNPNAISSVGARGLMQLMPQTAEDISQRNGIHYSGEYLLNPNKNIKLGNLYYAHIKSMLNYKDFYAILAYNGGVNAVSRWKEYTIHDDYNEFLEQVPYPETQNYLKKVMRSYWNYIRIY